MFKTSLKLAFAVGLVGAAANLTAAPAAAAFKIRVTDSLGDALTVQDNTAGDMNAAPGLINIQDNTLLGGHLQFLVTSAASKPLFPNSPLLAFQDVNIQASYDGALGAQSLTIEVTDTDFTLTPLPAVTPNVTLRSVASDNSTGAESATFQTWVTNNNTEFSHGPFSLGQQSGNSNLSGAIGMLTDPFQMGSETIIQFDGGAFVSMDNKSMVNAVPAPAGLVLLLTGSPALGLGYWLRRRQGQARPEA